MKPLDPKIALLNLQLDERTKELKIKKLNNFERSLMLAGGLMIVEGKRLVIRVTGKPH